MLIKVLQLLASLSLLVIIHEFGHYIFARIFKCRVEKFYLFFDWKFSLLKKKIGDTEYGVGWIPLGGYVKISGMVDESLDKEQLAQPIQPWEFRAKPAWQRLLIIVAGVVMNLVLAFAIYVGVAFAWGEQYIKTQDVKQGFEFSTTAQSIGFQTGDKVIEVGGRAVENSSEVAREILLSDQRDVLIERGSERLMIHVTESDVAKLLSNASSPFMNLRYPFIVADSAANGMMAGDSLTAVGDEQLLFADEFRARFALHKGDSIDVSLVRQGQTIQQRVAVDTAGRIGVHIAAHNIYPVTVNQYSIFEAIPRGAQKAIEQVSSYFDQLNLIFSPKTEAYKGVGGFIAMGKIFPDQWNWYAFWNITALLSIMLAVLNIMPIPGLDGGHLLFIVYEMIAGRAPSQKFMEAAQYVGFILILGLVLVVNASDVVKLFS
ncbi:MAG: RIP metalloprotease RseP [Mucinivorans sp.]